MSKSTQLYTCLLTTFFWSTAEATFLRDVFSLRRSPVSYLAQTTALCESQYSWMQNSKGQSPCLVAAFVEGACAADTWTVPQLVAGQKYDLPNSTTGTANGCTCSWASYNLLSGCTVCQGDAIAPGVQNWDAYRIQCGDFQSTTEYFPENITFPSGSSIPYWATINPTTWPDAHFDATTAQSDANEGKADVVPNSNQSNNSPSKQTVPLAALIGGIVGGIALVAFVAVSIFLYCRLKRRKVVPQSTSSVPSVMKRPFGSQWNAQALYAHQRSMSNMSQSTITSDASFLGIRQVATAIHNSANTPMSPPPLPTSPPLLPQSPSGVMNSPPMNATSLPQGPISPTVESLGHSSSIRSFFSSRRQPQNTVEPFIERQPTSLMTRKEVLDRAGTANIPDQVATVEEARTETASAPEPSEGDIDEPRRRRLNPPAYTPYPAGVPSFNLPQVPHVGRLFRKGSTNESEDTNMTHTPPESGSGATFMNQLGISPPTQQPNQGGRPPRYGNNANAGNANAGEGSAENELRIANSSEGGASIT